MASGGLPHGSVPPSGGGGRNGGGFLKIEGVHVAAAAVAVGATACYCMNRAFGRAHDDVKVVTDKFERLVQVLERWEKKTLDIAHGGLDMGTGSGFFQLRQGNGEPITRFVPETKPEDITVTTKTY